MDKFNEIILFSISSAIILKLSASSPISSLLFIFTLTLSSPFATLFVIVFSFSIGFVSSHEKIAMKIDDTLNMLCHKY